MPPPIPPLLVSPSIGTLAGVDLPNGISEELDRVMVGQYRTTIDGTEHADVVRLRRSWKIALGGLTQAQFNALDTVYANAVGGSVSLRLNSVGADVYVHLKQWQAKRIRGLMFGRDLTFTAEEV